MSGGSFNYVYSHLREAAECTNDKEISNLLKDLAELLHDEEWYQSGDYGKGSYEKTLANFKKKWFGTNREDRLKKYIDDSIEVLRLELYSLIQ